MELVQGLFSGKSHPTPQERPGRQSGTGYSLCRDCIAGSIQVNFLSTCFLPALRSSAHPGSHTGTYKASNRRRKRQVTLKGFVLILRFVVPKRGENSTAVSGVFLHGTLRQDREREHRSRYYSKHSCRELNGKQMLHNIYNQENIGKAFLALTCYLVFSNSPPNQKYNY